MGWSRGFSRGKSGYFRPRPAEAWIPKHLSDKLLGDVEGLITLSETQV